MQNHTRNEWRRCEKYTRNEQRTCKLHSKRVEKMQITLETSGEDANYTRNEWRRYKPVISFDHLTEHVNENESEDCTVAKASKI
jgi:hypothetical protein